MISTEEYEYKSTAWKIEIDKIYIWFIADVLNHLYMLWGIVQNFSRHGPL